MQGTEDIELLRRYASEKSEEAFALLVSRHINLVYSSALRQVRNAHLAEEITQSVFVLLARKASSLKREAVLSGWLYRAAGYVSADALRSERRRQHRETAAMEPLYQSSESESWREIEPVLDGAMAELPEGERGLILQRFFENKSLKEMGAGMGISEDAAQKRVARAIEKLRQIFARCGVAVSSAGVTGALAVFGAQTAPPALAASVAALAVSAGTPLGISFLTQATLKIMAMTKLKAAIGLAALAVAVSVPLVSQQRALTALRNENEALQAKIHEPGPEAAPAKINETEFERLRRDAAEVPRLRGQIVALMQERASAAAAGRVAPAKKGAAAGGDPNNPMDRQTLGDQLMAEGKFPEALENYLWCYDEGAKKSPSYVGVRGSFLLMKIKELAARYPAAHDALLSRRDGLEASIKASSSVNPMAIHDLMQLNDSLGEPVETMGFFDELPATHPARSTLVNLAGDQFLKAGRYQEMVNAGNPEAAFDTARMVAKTAGEQMKDNEGLQAMMRRRAVEAGGQGLEALAAMGQVERATALVDKILSFDSSPETRGELLKHAERAKNAGVVAHLKAK